jgi:hypothetical protein
MAASAGLWLRMHSNARFWLASVAGGVSQK